MKTTTFTVHTGGRETVHDITGQCEQFAGESSSGGDGLLNVFVPHATAGVAIIELGAGSDTDLLAVLSQLLPEQDVWRHAHGSRGHGRSHVLPAFVAPSVTVPVLAAGSHWAPGSPSPWSTSTSTILTGKCVCRSSDKT